MIHFIALKCTYLGSCTNWFRIPIVITIFSLVVIITHMIHPTIALYGTFSILTISFLEFGACSLLSQTWMSRCIFNDFTFQFGTSRVLKTLCIQLDQGQSYSSFDLQSLEGPRKNKVNTFKIIISFTFLLKINNHLHRTQSKQLVVFIPPAHRC